MLSAQCEVAGKQENFVLEHIRHQWTAAQIDQTFWACRHCEQQVKPVRMLDKAWHFRHLRSHDCPYTEKYGGGESGEHFDLKVQVAREVMQAHAEHPWKVDYEVPIRIEDLEGPPHKRIADVLLTRADGVQLIIEIQLSQIAHTVLLERNRDYRQAGFDVWWAFKSSTWATLLTQHLTSIGQHVLLLEPENHRRVLARGV